MDRVKVSIGKTYNLGNYESLRLDVGIEMDCEEPHKAAFVLENAKEFCNEKLAELERERGIK